MHSHEVIIPVLAIVGFFSTVITFIYMRYRSKHQQRMALIDTGKTADIFVEKNLDQKSNALKTGMLLTGAGVGLLIAMILEEYTRLDGEILIPFGLVGGGLGLIFFYNRIKSSGYNELD